MLIVKKINYIMGSIQQPFFLPSLTPSTDDYLGYKLIKKLYSFTKNIKLIRRIIHTQTAKIPPTKTRYQYLNF